MSLKGGILWLLRFNLRCLAHKDTAKNARLLKKVHLSLSFLLALPALRGSLSFTFSIDFCCERTIRLVSMYGWDVVGRRSYSSNCNAIRYAKKISTLSSTPATFPLYNAVPRNEQVLPQYIGAPVTLNGKPSTFSSIRIPK